MSKFRRNLMMQSGKSYEIVDHILTNGLAYIDTGYFVNPNTEVEMNVMLEKNENSDINTFDTTIGNSFFYCEEDIYAYGINHGGNSYEFNIFYSWTNVSYSNGGPVVSLTGYLNTENSMIKLFYHPKYLHYTTHTGGAERAANSPTHTYVNDTLKLFINQKKYLYNRSIAHVYHFKIMEKGQVIKHFVPAKKGYIYGMADIIEGKFYASPNGESFSY